MTAPEQQAREEIDRLLRAAGWHVCDADKANIHAARGVAIREFALPGHGFADYLLYVDGKNAGVWPAQIQAFQNLEHSLKENRPCALIQMATPKVVAGFCRAARTQ